MSLAASRRISPTAYYTGYVWFRNKEADQAFATSQGRGLYWLVRQSRLTPWLEGWLLARHRLIDFRLAMAIERGEISQIIEIAAGLSPRGWRFRQRFGDRITYLETDLPEILAAKREILDKLGGETTHHRTIELDALAESTPHSLEAICSSLDRKQGTAIITEGLLLYVDKSDVLALWRRISTILRSFAHGIYLADLCPMEWPNTFSASFSIWFLSRFVRGRVHQHFSSSAEAAQALWQCGLVGDVLDPSAFSKILGLDANAARYGRVIDVQARP